VKTQPPRRGMRYRYRLVPAMLLVSVPLMVGLAVVLTTSASASLTSLAQNKGGGVARAVTLRVEDWITERQEEPDRSGSQGQQSAGCQKPGTLEDSSRFSPYQMA
jgi:hypothetical protein